MNKLKNLLLLTLCFCAFSSCKHNVKGGSGGGKDPSKGKYTITYHNLDDFNNIKEYALDSGTLKTSFDVTEDVELKVNGISKDYYFFDGWYDNEDFEGTAITGWSAGEIESDVDLYAKWYTDLENYKDALDALDNTKVYKFIIKDEGTDIDGLCADVKASAATFDFDMSGLVNVTVMTKTNKMNEAASLCGVNLPCNLKEIAQEMFAKCPNLRKAILPESLEHFKIGTDLFNYCDDITIVFPKSLVEYKYSSTGYQIGDYIGYYTTNVIGLVAEGTELIGSYAFWNFDGLIKIILPDSVKKIDDYGISFCDNLSTIIIGNGLEEISYGAFSKDKNLLGLILPEGLKTIYSSGGAYNETFDSCVMLKKIEIPSSVTYIGPGLFSGCSLDELIISVDLMNDYANSKSSSGDYYNLLERKSTIKKLHLKAGEDTELKDYFLTSGKVSEVVIPENIEVIGKQAFNGCTNLKIADIPSSVKTIKEQAFNGCGIESVVIPDSVTLLGTSAFRSTSMKSLYISNNLEVIDEWAFGYNEFLTEITGGKSIKTLKKCVFSNCTKLSTYPDFPLLEEINQSDFAYTKIENVTFSTAIRKINRMAFYKSPLKSVIFPETSNWYSYIYSFDNYWEKEDITKATAVSEDDIKAFATDASNFGDKHLLRVLSSNFMN